MQLCLRILVIVAAIGPLIGCTTAVPMAVLTEDWQLLRGSTTSYADDSFVVTNGTLMCGGNYNPLRGNETAIFAVRCSDGREGFGSATRDAGARSGTGIIHMDDGTAAHFMFGEAATFI